MTRLGISPVCCHHSTRGGVQSSGRTFRVLLVFTLANGLAWRVCGTRSAHALLATAMTRAIRASVSGRELMRLPSRVARARGRERPPRTRLRRPLPRLWARLVARRPHRRPRRPARDGPSRLAEHGCPGQAMATPCYLCQENEGTFPHGSDSEPLGLACPRCHRIVTLAGENPAAIDVDRLA